MTGNRLRGLGALLVTAASVVALCAPDARAAGPITYTVEPWDFDGTYGITMNVTQLQFGGTMCPCRKIAYPADGMHNQAGADAINTVASKYMRPGDTLMGFSLGAQVISLYASQHTPPPGVHILLAGDTLASNAARVAAHQGIPATIANDTTLVVNEYDGWSDMPTRFNAGWGAAFTNAILGLQRLHYYAAADPHSPANVVTHQGNITAVLIPTVSLPIDPAQRDLINTAYDRPGSSSAQRAQAAAEQVPSPLPSWPQHPEPAAGG
jgi:hypothetical protein